MWRDVAISVLSENIFLSRRKLFKFQAFISRKSCRALHLEPLAVLKHFGSNLLNSWSWNDRSTIARRSLDDHPESLRIWIWDRVKTVKQFARWDQIHWIRNLIYLLLFKHLHFKWCAFMKLFRDDLLSSISPCFSGLKLFISNSSTEIQAFGKFTDEAKA